MRDSLHALGVMVATLGIACGSPSAARPSPAYDDRVFEDVAARAGLALSPRVEPHGLPERVAGGVCVLSLEGGAPHELFFASYGAVGRSRLFVARRPLDYRDETDARGLGAIADAVGCSALDVDLDGDTDLIVTRVGGVDLYLQTAGHFDLVADALPTAPTASTLYAGVGAGDLDDDGDVDLVVAGYVDADATGLAADCRGLPCASLVQEYAPAPSRLLLNDGHGHYTDATAALAPALLVPEPTLVLAVTDLDQDGRADLFVGNDLADSYANRALVRDADGVYRDRADALGLALDARSSGVDTMGFSAGDLDGDGTLDFALTAFEGWPSPIYLCARGSACRDESARLGTTLRAESFRWGNALADFDLDGDLDLFEATGHVFSEAEGEALGFAFASAQAPNLYWNDGADLRALEPTAEEALSHRWPGRGVARVDLDDDGRPDVVVATTGGAPALLHNVFAPRLRPLTVEVRPPRQGDRVVVDDGVRRQLRYRTSGDGYLGSSDPRFFLGVDPSARSVEVTLERADGSRITRVTGADHVRIP